MGDIKNEYKLDKETRNALKVVDALLFDYHSVVLVDGETHKVMPFRTVENQSIKSAMDMAVNSASYDEAIDAYIDAYIAPEDREEVRAKTKFDVFTQEILDTKAYRVQFRRVTKINSSDYTEMCFVKIAFDDSEMYAIAFRDINEAALERITEQTVITAFAQDYDYISVVNPNTFDEIIIRQDPSFNDLLPGWDNSNFVEKVALVGEQIVHPEDKEYYDEAMSKEVVLGELESKDIYRVNFREIFGEQVVYYQAVFSCIEYANTKNYVVGFHSIDDQMKKELAHQAELEEAVYMAQAANRAKTTFLSNMSHDIRTPMNAIIGFTSLAATHIDNKEQVLAYLKKISQSSEHLLSLINDVLDMSRIESGRMHIEEKEENLSEIIHSLRNIVQADIQAREIDFYIDSVDMYDEYVFCDKLRINQMLLNVLSNAIKYTPNGGHVALKISEKEIKQNGRASYEFRIKDDGIGMTEEFLSTIFQPFSRAHSSTKSGVEGTGLGMAITKNIVDMLGGTIDVKSTIGKGTEFIINLEFRLATEHNVPVVIPQVEGLRGLVVDDNTDTCISVSKMLKEIGMRSEWCTSGKEAVIRTEEAVQYGDNYKVYIIDWLMPDMNGIETTRRIRRVVGDEAPIIILTAYDWTDIEEEAREAGVTGFVPKPLFPSDLHKVLAECCGIADPSDNKPLDNYNLTGHKVLLVDDNELNREIACDILVENGMIVKQATDGTEAVEIMENAKPGDFDLILMDIQMPVMDGHEATRNIRKLANKDVANIPIIAMTANAFAEDKEAALAAGMNEHLAKPINIDALKNVIAKYLK